MIKPEKLIMATAELAGCKYGEIIGDERTVPLPFCRMLIAEYYKMQHMSNKQVGEVIHKHPSSVNHYNRQLANIKAQPSMSEQAILNKWDDTIARLEREELEEQLKNIPVKVVEKPHKCQLSKQLEKTREGKCVMSDMAVLYCCCDIVDTLTKELLERGPHVGVKLTSELKFAVSKLTYGGKLFRNQISKEPVFQCNAVRICADIYLLFIRTIIDRSTEDVDMKIMYDALVNTFPSKRGFYNLDTAKAFVELVKKENG